MSSRSRMRYRALTQRDSRVANDYGDTGVQNWATSIAALPCHVWNKNTASAGGERYSTEVPISDYQPVMICPLGSDVVETDRVFNVKDLRDNELFGLMEITSVIRRHDHLEVRMTDHA